MTSSCRVRIAPSPTGAFHVGTARTALFNFLFARQNKGSFIVRIEDTDRIRSTTSFERNILEGLRWLGLSWDEGPDCGGRYGPYRQSERKDFYLQAEARLLRQGNVYPCYCMPEELESERREQLKRGEPPLYSGKCRTASESKKKQWEREGRSPLYRFIVLPEHLTFNDIIRGTIKFETELLGDFGVARGFDDPLYNLAVVVDDAAMKISHVIRGEDHISNTPKQVLLYRALGLPQPLFAHLPLLLAPNKSKLSKRDAATSVMDYASQGYLSEAIVNFLALCGWNPKNNEEFFTIDELILNFRLDHVQKAGAVFDLRKLAYMNKHYVRELPPAKILERAGERLRRPTKILGDQIHAAVLLVRDRCPTVNDLAPAMDFLCSIPEYSSELLIPKEGNAQRTLDILKKLAKFISQQTPDSFDVSSLRSLIMDFLKEQRFSTAESLWPLRVALSGQSQSPGVFEIAAILRKEGTTDRIKSAITKLAERE